MNFEQMFQGSFVEKITTNNKLIVLLGISKVTRLAVLAFNQINIPIEYVAVLEPQETSKFEGVSVVNLKDILSQKEKFHIVNCTEDFHRTNILLESLGVTPSIRRFTNKAKPYIDLYESEEKIEKAIELFNDPLSKAIFMEQLNHRFHFDGIFFESLMTKPQYFDPSIFSFEDQEIFIDGGSFDGDSALEFITRMRGKFSHIHCFEPEPSNFQKLVKIPLLNDHMDMITFNQKGLYDGKKTLEFYSLPGSGGAKILKGGNSQIDVIDLDSYLNGEIATFIKLDVEGADIPAIEGAYNAITKYRPKLCISLYHRSNHLWKIPNMIAGWVPEYKFHLRHHHWNSYETVLYASI